MRCAYDGPGGTSKPSRKIARAALSCKEKDLPCSVKAKLAKPASNTSRFSDSGRHLDLVGLDGSRVQDAFLT
jgi:hypothetical protein